MRITLKIKKIILWTCFAIILLFFSCVGLGAYIIFRLGDPAPNTVFELSPLAHEKFRSLTSSTEPFSNLYLIYKKVETRNLIQLTIDGGGISHRNNYMNALNKFHGSLNKAETFTEAQFTPQEMNLIFDYLDKNSAYFFNGSEFKGLKIPYRTRSWLINRENAGLCFKLLFFEAGSNTKAWVIQKCADEPLKADDPLHDLFEIIEKRFIARFQETKPISTGS